MRYQNLLGQRYLALVQTGKRGAELDDGATVPLDRTDPGFDLTELLNGFRPLFEVLRPGDVNQLASSLVQVLQGEGGTVEQLLQQTTQLTTYVADRDAVIGEVLTNLTPVLEHLQGRGTEIESTVLELRRLMEGLAKDRTAIGASIDGVAAPGRHHVLAAAGRPGAAGAGHRAVRRGGRRDGAHQGPAEPGAGQLRGHHRRARPAHVVRERDERLPVLDDVRGRAG